MDSAQPPFSSWPARLRLAGLGLLLVAASLPAVAAAAAPAPGARDIAAVFPLWWSPDRALIAAASAGAVQAGGAGSHILIVHADTPGLASRLRGAGALLLLDAQGRGACSPTPSNGTAP